MSIFHLCAFYLLLWVFNRIWEHFAILEQLYTASFLYAMRDVEGRKFSSEKQFRS